MSIKMEVLGIRDVERLLNAKTNDAKKAATAAIKESTLYVEGSVVESIAGRKAEPASVDTGRLKNSVKVKFPNKYEGKVYTDVVYADHIEYGTSKFTGRHHFRNTAKREENKIRKFVNEKIKKAM